MTALGALVTHELGVETPPAVATAARLLAEAAGGVAVLFYGSVLRTGDLSGVIDFYVLTERVGGGRVRRLANRWLWPEVSYHEIAVGGETIRAKVATMPLDIFARAAAGETLDTTIWARFVQPSALVWVRDDASATRVRAAVAAAAVTAAGFAAMLGPTEGAPRAFWKALFAETYRTEFRVEKKGREDQILTFDPKHFDALLPAAWEVAGIGFEAGDEGLKPRLAPDRARALKRAWKARRRMGKPLNFARLLKAAFTFDGAARYALWKIERHTGLAIALTPWRERHPILAAPGVLWRVWRTAGSR
ncbi:hypothetical protein DFR49_3914 [Hephaestia caeni]|uniref:Uncharacterized protein n=1 Tax=Hephaestia caeni TaxID=645617 RepID=A0A397NGL4_9SPHN|nr:hypothetical protein [Hephaestia caeni]RIA36630.1 hypothetical protein DFR49_3914 [Hephaestia caeni]